MFSIPDAGAPSGAPVPPVATCAREVHTAEKVPLDLVLLVDASDSMSGMSGAQSKWERARAALGAFVKDPGSAGLGVGVAFFPGQPAELRCQADADCAGVTMAPMAPSCGQQGVCQAPGVPLLADRVCSPGARNIFNCPAGMTCRPRGTCSQSGTLCVEAEAPCGAAGDVCRITPGTCRTAFDGCRLRQFGQLDVEIGDLPARAEGVLAALAATEPDGSTPMGLAVDSVLGVLAARQQASGSRRSAMVLATDGLPQCEEASVDAVEARLDRARASIPTYVIGVFGPAEIAEAGAALKRFATAGGTGSPFLLEAGDDLNQRLLEALKEIRGLALACDYAIPAPGGGAIDFGRVNVRTTVAGAAELLYVGSADRCQPDRGGWYYEPAPSATTRPTRLVLCPDSCARLRTDPAARVELEFGCATRSID